MLGLIYTLVVPLLKIIALFVFFVKVKVELKKVRKTPKR